MDKNNICQWEKCEEERFYRHRFCRKHYNQYRREKYPKKRKLLSEYTPEELEQRKIKKRQQFEEYKARFPERRKETVRKNHEKTLRNLKQQVFEKLGFECNCCGEKCITMLTVDHIDGTGADDRRERRYQKLYKAIANGTEPLDNYQILCQSCNSSKHLTGQNKCEHQIKKERENNAE